MTCCSKKGPCCPGKAEGEAWLTTISKAPEASAFEKFLGSMSAKEKQEIGAAALAAIVQDLYEKDADFFTQVYEQQPDTFKEQIQSGAYKEPAKDAPLPCPSKVAGRRLLGEVAKQPLSDITYNTGVSFLVAVFKAFPEHNAELFAQAKGALFKSAKWMSKASGLSSEDFSALLDRLSVALKADQAKPILAHHSASEVASCCGDDASEKAEESVKEKPQQHTCCSMTPH